MLTGALATIADAVRDVAAKPHWSRGDAELTAACAAVHQLEQRLAGIRLGLLGELDERDLARDNGATSTTAWVRWRLRVPAGPAAAMVRLARALRSCPTTAAALESGDLTEEQARAIVSSVAALAAANDHMGAGRIDPSAADIQAERRAEGCERPSDHCPVDAPAAGERPGEGSADEAAAGDLPAVVSAQVIADVERLLIGHAAALDPRGLRVAGEHALATIAPELAERLERRALDDAERRAVRLRRLDLHDDMYGGTVLRGYLDREGATILRTALGPLSGPRGTGDDRPAGARRADALVEICHKVMNDATLPTRGGQPTQVVVTTRFDALTRSLGVGQTDGGDKLSAAVVRRMACAATIVPAVLGGEGQVLDLGRSRRLFTGAVRRALDLRDGGCAFPACDRPRAWADAHHIVPWLDGGPTTMDNGVLVCRIHHVLLHEPGGWQVRLGPDRLPEFVPPRWIDPGRRPLRNSRHASRPP
jgi:hypothetical protein